MVGADGKFLLFAIIYWSGCNLEAQRYPYLNHGPDHSYPYLQGHLGEKLLQVHDALHQAQEIAAGRTRLTENNKMERKRGKGCLD